jgi:L-lactate dehydrogenase complex protein LldG
MSAANGEARAKMMAAVRSALLVRGDEPGRRGTVRARLERAPIGLVPARAKKQDAERIAAFQAMLEVQGTTVRQVAKLDGLPAAIATYLTEQNLPARLRHGADPLIAGLPWEGVMIDREEGPADPSDLVSLSRAVGGAAETGTLFLISGVDNPSTLNFLPDTHCVVILSSAISGGFEEVWGHLRTSQGQGKMPRTVNLISGPSCTADIEQTIIRGAHGPRRLAVFIVNDAAAADPA